MLALALAFGRDGMAPTGHCAPAYLGMEPWAARSETYQFLVRVTDGPRLLWEHEYTFASRPCCEQTRGALEDLSHQVRDRVTVGPCL